MHQVGLSNTVFTRVIHAFNTIFKNYRFNQIYLRKIVSSHKSRTLNLDTKFWLKKCVNYASKYGIAEEWGKLRGSPFGALSVQSNSQKQRNLLHGAESFLDS